MQNRSAADGGVDPPASPVGDLDLANGMDREGCAEPNAAATGAGPGHVAQAQRQEARIARGRARKDKGDMPATHVEAVAASHMHRPSSVERPEVGLGGSNPVERISRRRHRRAYRGTWQMALRTRSA